MDPTICAMCGYSLADPYIEHFDAGYVSRAHAAAFCCIECRETYRRDLNSTNREAWELDRDVKSASRSPGKGLSR